MYKGYVTVWDNQYIDYNEHELTGREYALRSDAEHELIELQDELRADPFVESYYIKEV